MRIHRADLGLVRSKAETLAELARDAEDALADLTEREDRVGSARDRARSRTQSPASPAVAQAMGQRVRFKEAN